MLEIRKSGGDMFYLTKKNLFFFSSVKLPIILK
jgi:hypothetical protein